jgi:hypothetical protein
MRIEEIEAGSELEKRVVVEMEGDGHFIPFPTHSVMADGLVIGAYSLHFAPCFFFWMHTKRGTAITSYKAIQTAIGDIVNLGHSNPLLLVGDGSIYTPFLDRLGFMEMGTGRLMIHKGG